MVGRPHLFFGQAPEGERGGSEECNPEALITGTTRFIESGCRFCITWLPCLLCIKRSPVRGTVGIAHLIPSSGREGGTVMAHTLQVHNLRFRGTRNFSKVTQVTSGIAEIPAQPCGT